MKPDMAFGSMFCASVCRLYCRRSAMLVWLELRRLRNGSSIQCYLFAVEFSEFTKEPDMCSVI